MKKAKGVAGHPAAQVVLVDTPGVHKPETQLDRRMMQEVHDALESRDAVLFLVDATHRLPRGGEGGGGAGGGGRGGDGGAGGGGGEEVYGERSGRRVRGRMTSRWQLVRKLECPVVLVLNKIDAVKKEELLAADCALERAAHVCGRGA